MVKKPTVDEEEFEGLDDDELDEDELEELEKTEKRKLAPKKAAKKSPEPKRRFTVFSQPPRLGIADAETGEVIGEGETAILEILANILERLERMETNLGSMMEE